MLSDCEKCWDTPCECGHNYKKWTAERLTSLIDNLAKIRDKKTQTLKKGK